MMSRRTELVIILTTLLITFIGGVILGKASSRSATKEEEKEVEVQKDTLDEWTTLQMAIAMTESQFNPKAVGATKDWGVIQITPIYVKECNRILGEEKYTHSDAFDIEKSLEMFEIMQAHYNPNRDLDKAIRYHNRADWYAKKVKKNIIFIQQMEEFRKQVI